MLKIPQPPVKAPLTTSPSQVSLVVLCVTLLATEAAVGGIFLHIKGFPQGAGLTFLSLNTAISGLIGFLGGRVTATPQIIPEIPKLR